MEIVEMKRVELSLLNEVAVDRLFGKPKKGERNVSFRVGKRTVFHFSW